mgnify:CR=1 FL=1
MRFRCCQVADKGQIIGKEREINVELHYSLSEKQSVQKSYKVLIYNRCFYSFSVQVFKKI